VQRRAGALQSVHAELGALSPYRVLSRGYALTTDRRGRVLGRAAALSPGQQVSLRYHDGLAVSTIESVESEKHADA